MAVWVLFPEVVIICIGVAVAMLIGFMVYGCFRSVLLVEEGTAAIVERFGKFHRRIGSGVYFLVPFVDRLRPYIWRYSESHLTGGKKEGYHIVQKRLRRVDLREGVLDFPMQEIITRDNVALTVHPMLVYQLIDPVRVVYEVYDLPHAVEKLVQTTLRSIIGDMGLDDTLASREEINRTLTTKISSVCLNWGFRLKRCELLEIVPSREVQLAMHKQIAAERLRRASLISASGFRERVRTEAEGACQSQIALAEGEKRVGILRASGVATSKESIIRAEAEAIRLLTKPLQEVTTDPARYAAALRYLDTLASICLRAARCIVYFPAQTLLSGALRDISTSSGRSR